MLSNLTNFPNGVASFGLPVYGGGTIPTTTGTVYFVDYDNGSDGNDGLSLASAFKTVEFAYSRVVTNHNDVIALAAGSNHPLAAMLTVAKNKVHFIGLGVGQRLYGQRTKISMGVTAVATDIAVIKNTGSGNTFTNIKFTQNNSVAQALSVVAEGGEYAVYTNCEFYRSTLLNGATSCELLDNGDSAQFYNCTFGSLADAVVGNVIHPCVRLANGQVGSGLVMRDNYFQNCLFWRNAGGTTTAFVYAAASADVERMMTFKDCMFINAKNAAATPAAAVVTGATLDVGNIILKDCAAVGCTKLSTSTGVIVAGPAYSDATGISVNAA
jgi:hypothetical protein